MFSDSRAARRAALLLSLLAWTEAGALAQLPEQAGAGVGRFANFETPQTHPLEVFSLAGNGVTASYVAVCNTPNSSVEIYAAGGGSAPPLASVRVGLGPVSVRWQAQDESFGFLYVCNFDGDSVSRVRVTKVGGLGATAVVEQTSHVGDEPSDIAFDPITAGEALVTLSSSGEVARIQTATLAVLGEERLSFVDTSVSTPLQGQVHMPRQIAWLPNDLLLVANMRGGGKAYGLPGLFSPTGGEYDCGLYTQDRSQAPPVGANVRDLGSTNHAFALNAAKDLVFVVGTKAQNTVVAGEAGVAALPTGFVQSWLMVADVLPNGTILVRDEAPGASGSSSNVVPSINLNRDYAGSGTLDEVDPLGALVQPAAIEVVERMGSDGSWKTFVVLGAYHSDRLAVLEPDASVPGGYVVSRTDLQPVSASDGYGVIGPRGIGHVSMSPTVERIFVHGRLNHSLMAYDLDVDTGALTPAYQRHLGKDPTPLHVRSARKFLYSNRFSDVPGWNRDQGFVACASCHVDGRTDGLPWDLGVHAAGGPIPAWFHDDNGGGSMLDFPAQKGRMVTQTLQGLVNAPLNVEAQFMATNAPYHWRGDRASFLDFNGAFVDLQRMPALPQPPEEPVRGIPDADMRSYESFVTTILHPPNPEQEELRVPSGSLGTDPNDPLQATGALLGMQLFHNNVFNSGRSCVDCHSLPDGSSNTSTLRFDQIPTLDNSGSIQSHPLESAALRNIAQREQARGTDFLTQGWRVVSNTGILHPGSFFFLGGASINSFILAQFQPLMPGVPGGTVEENYAVRMEQTAAVIEFVRHFDTGTAPFVGRAFTLDPYGAAGANFAQLVRFRNQALEANIGLAVYASDQGVVRGYWFDPLISAFRQDGAPSNIVTIYDLDGWGQDPAKTVILQATPLGAERNWADLNDDVAVAAPGVAPSQVRLEPMAPNTYFTDVTKFTGNLLVNVPIDSNLWTRSTLRDFLISLGREISVRHEPPRRFRVSGQDIRPGAKMILAMPGPGGPGGGDPFPVFMDLFPTGYVAEVGPEGDTSPVWETRVELDEIQTLACLVGGYFAPGVTETLLRTTSAPSLADWNLYQVFVLNEDGTLGASGLQPLEIQDDRN